VLHHKLSTERYHLRRYFPSSSFLGLIEQFWFVNWDLKVGDSHIQTNLPDPNFHLILDNRKLKLMGPISKTYSYEMAGSGDILGIKFALGALSAYLELPLLSYIDKEIDFQQLVDFDVDVLVSKLLEMKSDELKIDMLQTHLTPLAIISSPELLRVRELVNLIQNNPEISKVEHLSEKSNLSIRTIQRCFKHYLGLSPKWLIRKYRLHQALELLENPDVNILDVVEWLGYVDQSHLIRDFKEMIGVTPNNHINL
jgi:AraC-like DNA-binding protein